ncbi:unnamed protein product [Lactuca virosa]|uniref:Uncharacterized protein n=1 Tax=Lactuca virosa TaxID=75947 RepID=A0AAU9P7M6_9ASTR|nr:unnamed protein product [Lactuca virosa]
MWVNRMRRTTTAPWKRQRLKVTKIKAIIESLVRREGHLIVVDDEAQGDEEYVLLETTGFLLWHLTIYSLKCI